MNPEPLSLGLRCAADFHASIGKRYSPDLQPEHTYKYIYIYIYIYLFKIYILVNEYSW